MAQTASHFPASPPQELEVALQNSQDFWLLLVLAPVEQCGERCTTAMSTFEKVAAKASDVLRFGVLSVFDSLPGVCVCVCLYACGCDVFVCLCRMRMCGI